MKTSWERTANMKVTNLACGQYISGIGTIKSMVNDGTTMTIFYFAGGNAEDERMMCVPIDSKLRVWVRVHRTH